METTDRFNLDILFTEDLKQIDSPQETFADPLIEIEIEIPRDFPQDQFSDNQHSNNQDFSPDFQLHHVEFDLMNKAVEEAAEEAQRNYDNISKSYDDLTKKYNDITQIASNLLKDNRVLADNHALIEQKLADSFSTAESIYLEKDDQITRLSKRLNHTEIKFNQATSDLKTSQKKVQELTYENEMFESQIISLKADKESAEQECADLEKEKDDVLEEYNRLLDEHILTQGEHILRQNE
jgi:chromosome segregation ATPase